MSDRADQAVAPPEQDALVLHRAARRRVEAPRLDGHAPREGGAAGKYW
jgi:hypothetical protein